jgi:hypothetical protein
MIHFVSSVDDDVVAISPLLYSAKLIQRMHQFCSNMSLIASTPFDRIDKSELQFHLLESDSIMHQLKEENK